MNKRNEVLTCHRLFRFTSNSLSPVRKYTGYYDINERSWMQVGYSWTLREMS